jgi:hypothetical protein
MHHTDKPGAEQRRLPDSRQLAIGRIVRYVGQPPMSLGLPKQECPAIITNVLADSAVNLRIFPDGHDVIDFVEAVPHDEGTIEQSQSDQPTRTFAARTWHWPPR